MTRPQPELPDLSAAPPSPAIPDSIQSWDGKLSEILARVEAIERALFEPGAAPHSPVLPTGDAEDPARLVKLLVSQQESLAGMVAERLAQGLAEQQAFLTGSFQALREELTTIAANAGPSALPAPVDAARPARGTDESGERDWLNAIFGLDLAGNPRIASRIGELSERVRRSDSAASVLAGQLLIFQGAAPERRPQLLKDIGEAFYRAFPELAHAEDEFEQTLARWLEHGCEPAGFQNAIEFVRIGQRFDSTRHLADGPGGVEITGVSGWVVLRGRDKVYTKAVVTAR